MTLQQIFKKYNNPKKEFERRSARVKIGYSLKWLKDLHAWAGNKEDTKKLKEMGFFIPHCMIEGANANDWEEHFGG